jgi:hypothetical protein
MASVGEGADGLVRVELDDGGLIGNVVLDERAMDLPAARLSAGLVDAIREAQERVALRLAEQPSTQRLAAAAAEATLEAERRFDEISTVLHDLDRRAGRSW